jgi:hypothetical protein
MTGGLPSLGELPIFLYLLRETWRSPFVIPAKAEGTLRRKFTGIHRKLKKN